MFLALDGIGDLQAQVLRALKPGMQDGRLAARLGVSRKRPRAAMPPG